MIRIFTLNQRLCKSTILFARFSVFSRHNVDKCAILVIRGLGSIHADEMTVVALSLTGLINVFVVLVVLMLR